MRLQFEKGRTTPPPVENCPPFDVRDAGSLDFQECLRKGISAAQIGDRESARTMLERASVMDPNSEEAWLWLASISDYPEELLAFLNNVLSINPVNKRAIEWLAATRSLLAKTLVRRGIDAHEQGDDDLAKQCFEQALANDQNCEIAWFWQAAMTSSIEKKTIGLKRVLELNPDNLEAQEALRSIMLAATQAAFDEARSVALAGENERAVGIIDEILGEQPENSEGWILRSHLASDMKGKIESLERALEIDPANAVARSNHEILTAAAKIPEPEREEPARNELAASADAGAGSSNAEMEATQEVEPDAYPAPTTELSKDTSDDKGEDLAAITLAAITLEEISRQDVIENGIPKGMTILVIDDSPTVRKLVAAKLEGSGHDVMCAADGVNGLEKIAERMPDLVLLDIGMPGMDGYEVCRNIRSNPEAKDLPVVMISGKDGFFDEIRGRAAGATGHVTKPFGPEALMKALETYLVTGVNCAA